MINRRTLDRLSTVVSLSFVALCIVHNHQWDQYMLLSADIEYKERFYSYHNVCTNSGRLQYT